VSLPRAVEFCFVHVMPAKAGIQRAFDALGILDSRLRGND